MVTKFQYSMLSARDTVEPEAQKEMNQIHDYMDMSNNKYGYIITQTELIMFRRRDTPVGNWGQMDFSQSIPVSTKKGRLNAMMILWYFPVKYAVMGLDGDGSSSRAICAACSISEHCRSRRSMDRAETVT